MTNPWPAQPAGPGPASGPVGATPVGGPARAEPRRRLHPLTPLLRGAKLVALAIAAISWQGYRDLGMFGWLVAVAGVMVFVLAGSVVSWLVTGYHVVGRELRVYEGLIWRRTRAIPLERLQSVELVRPLLARAVGLAELRLEVVGAAKTEAPLAYLPVDHANQLRERLLMLARSTGQVTGSAGAPTPAAGPGGALIPGAGGLPRPEVGASPVAAIAARLGPPPEHRIHAVANRDLVISQLLRPQWWTLPLAVAVPVLFLAYENDLTFIGIASTLTAVIGAVQAPVRVLLADWAFTIGEAAGELRLHRGLLETRSQTVPPRRIQTITVQWPWLWRWLGWVRAHMTVAGVAAGDGGQRRSGSLLPVADVPTAERVIAEALPGFALTAVSVRPVPRRAGWLAPLRRRVLGYQLTDTAFVARDGLLTRQLVIVPYTRIQSVRVRQGPLQRVLRLASVWVDPAGSGPAGVAPHLDPADAMALAAELAERSRAARRHPGPGGAGPAEPDGSRGVDAAGAAEPAAS